MNRCADCGTYEPFVALGVRWEIEYARTGRIVMLYGDGPTGDHALVCIDRFDCEYRRVRSGVEQLSNFTMAEWRSLHHAAKAEGERRGVRFGSA